MEKLIGILLLLCCIKSYSQTDSSDNDTSRIMKVNIVFSNNGDTVKVSGRDIKSINVHKYMKVSVFMTILPIIDTTVNKIDTTIKRH